MLGAIHGFLVTRLRLQPFVVTLCGLLIYRGVARYYTDDDNAASAMAAIPNARMARLRAKLRHVPHTFIMFLVVAGDHGRGAAPLGFRPLSVCRRQERGSGALLRHPHRAVSPRPTSSSGGLPASRRFCLVFYTRLRLALAHGNFYELYAIAAAVLGGCSLRGGEGSILGIVLGTVLLQVLQNLVNMLGIPSSLNFAVMGRVILFGVLADRQFAERRRRATASVARPREPGAGVSPKAAQLSPVAATGPGAAGAPGTTNRPGAEQ